jgi:fructose-1,6-bisphosphatase/inositol monophosphatase family enzyme
MEDYLKFAKRVALQAGDIMLEHFHEEVEHREKADKTIVTVADEAINQMVIEEVEKAYPEHSVFGEEASTDKQSEFAWVCDPIDGTVPYANGVPVSVFSLALVKDGVPIVGVVYEPFMKRMYAAEKDGGAFLNDERISVSSLGLERHATLNIEWWPEAEYDIDTALHNISLDTKAYVLHLGCVVNAACWVAWGRYEACVFAGTKGKNVDIAAVKVIVEEAGGKVTDINGNEQRYDGDINGAIITNGKIHEELVAKIKEQL